MVTIYEMKAPTDDYIAEIERLAQAFGIDGEIQDRRHRDYSVVMTDDDPREGYLAGGVNIQTQDEAWNYGGSRPESLADDDRYEKTAPTDISDEQALRRAKRVWKRLDLDPNDYRWEVKRYPYVEETEKNERGSSLVVAVAYLIVDGRQTSIDSRIRFANGGDLYWISSSLRRPEAIDEVGLLSVEEAVVQASGEVATGIDVQVNEAELTWDSTFNRQTFRSFLLPMYRLPIGSTDPDLGLSNTIPAVRTGDLP